LKDNTPDVFFGIFYQFQQQLEKAGADNELEIERVRLAERKKIQQEDAKKKKVKPRGTAMADDSRNVMDDLITSIRSGAVYDRPEEKSPASYRRNSSLKNELRPRPYD